MPIRPNSASQLVGCRSRSWADSGQDVVEEAERVVLVAGEPVDLRRPVRPVVRVDLDLLVEVDAASAAASRFVRLQRRA